MSPSRSSAAALRDAYCLTSSTRRFFARPDSLSFETVGASGPTPLAVSRAAATRCLACSDRTTALALFCDSLRLSASVPTLSVWPTTCSRNAGSAVRSFAISLIGASDSGFKLDLPVSK